MKVPKRLEPLLTDGLIDEVVRPLMSGKEAAVYLVRAGGELRCAKVYKEANQRNFKNRAIYQEGRGVRGSRRGRAMQKRSKFGKQELEEAWQNAEVDALYKLDHAGVRVPKPYGFLHGVLLMELVTDGAGMPAPRLNDMTFTAEEARRHHRTLISDVVRMLCAGIIHGDLSEYNVLCDPEGPVIIDLPQAINAAANQAAQRLFERDVDNLAAYFARFAPELEKTRFGKEIWKLYTRGELHPEYELTGLFAEETRKADVRAVLRDIEDAREEHVARLPGRRVVELTPPPPRRRKPAPSRMAKPAPKPDAPKPEAAGGPASSNGDAPKRRRRRKRRAPDAASVLSAPQATRAPAPRPAPAPERPPKATTAQTEGAAPPQRKRRRRRRRKPPAS